MDSPISHEIPTEISGIGIGALNAGIKQSVRPDLCLIEMTEGTSCAALFTQNRFAAAPVIVAKRHLLENPNTRFLLINSGNANCGTGEPGIEDALQLCNDVAKIAGCDASAVLPFSTGVIGQRLPMDIISKQLSGLIENLRDDGWHAGAEAIMTTDTRPKIAGSHFVIGDKNFSVTGIAKGAGMIRPNMATMLSFIATDATVSPTDLNKVLLEAARKTFNRISIDGDTSTNDAVVLMATGKSHQEQLSPAHAQWATFCSAITEVCKALAKEIVADGEGASKFVEIEVRSGDEKTSEAVAFTVAESPLVKTALFASDPNWGRILAAVGRAPVPEFEIDQVAIYLGDYQIVRNGSVVLDYDEAVAAEIMAKQEIRISIEIGEATVPATVWTCDLSYDYVKINAEYRT